MTDELDTSAPSEVEDLYQTVYLPAGFVLSLRMCRRCGVLLPRQASGDAQLLVVTPEAAHDAFHEAFDALLAEAHRRAAAEEREYFEQAEERERSHAATDDPCNCTHRCPHGDRCLGGHADQPRAHWYICDVCTPKGVRIPVVRVVEENTDG